MSKYGKEHKRRRVMKHKTEAGATNEGVMIRVENTLRKRSAKALELARKHILGMEIETSKARQAIESYARDWDDITHPGILSLACEAVGGDPEEAVPLQAATLLLIAAMDLHDDIIDQSKMKNGRKTILGQFGEEITILIGDAFFLEGFAHLAKNEGRIPPVTLRRIIEAIEHAYFEVGNAHLLEAGLKGKSNVSPEEFLHVIEKKASSIGVHAHIGAILGRGTSKEIQALANYGKALGILVTLREEFIDIFEPMEMLNRMRNECSPLPLLYAFKDPDLKKNILDAVDKPRISKTDVMRVLNMLIEAGVIEGFRKRMRQLSLDALKSLSRIKNARTKDEMKLLLTGTLEGI